MTKRPQVRAAYSDFPKDPAARAEFELELFGQHLFFIRNRRIASISRSVNDHERRDQLGAIRRKDYEGVARLDEVGRTAALKLAETAIDLYMQDILELLSNIGNDLKVGDDCAIRYKLLVEIINLDLEVLWDDVINRNPRKHLPKYFGEWLNKYKNWGTESED